MKRKLLALLMIVIAVLNAHAQGQQVKGVVTSSDDGQPIPGVSVVVKGTTSGTTTDFDGQYTLTAPSGATLVFSFVGMSTAEEAVNGRTQINVALKANLQDIDEVVVVGYGTQKKSLVTGAISKVSGDDLKKTFDMRVTQALQGKTAGVVIKSNSGQPGDQV